MHIRINFSSSFYKHIYSSDNILLQILLHIQIELLNGIKLINFSKLMLILTLFAKSLMPKKSA